VTLAKIKIKEAKVKHYWTPEAHYKTQLARFVKENLALAPCPLPRFFFTNNKISEKASTERKISSTSHHPGDPVERFHRPDRLGVLALG
jgi:hypothetical protein